MSKVLRKGLFVACVACGALGCAEGAETPPTPRKDAGQDGPGLTDGQVSNPEAGLPEAGSDAELDPDVEDAAQEPPPEDAPCTATVVINEIQTGGAEQEDEFVELYNGGSCPALMDEFSLYYRSATGTTDATLWTAASGQKLGPGLFFVLGGAKYSGNPDFTMAPGASLAAGGGGLALKRGAKTIDMVGWGAANNAYVDSAPAPAPAPSMSVGRYPDGEDTDSNMVDFEEATPTPRKPNLKKQ
jgi:hypothetical protein